MDISSQGRERKKVIEVKTFPVPVSFTENQENLTIHTNTPSKASEEQILLKQGIIILPPKNLNQAKTIFMISERLSFQGKYQN